MHPDPNELHPSDTTLRPSALLNGCDRIGWTRGRLNSQQHAVTGALVRPLGKFLTAGRSGGYVGAWVS
jgi:hypothetical protein